MAHDKSLKECLEKKKCIKCNSRDIVFKGSIIWCNSCKTGINY